MQLRDRNFLNERDKHCQDNGACRNLESSFYRADQYGRVDDITSSRRTLQSVDQTKECADNPYPGQQAGQVFEELSMYAALEYGLRIEDGLCGQCRAVGLDGPRPRLRVHGTFCLMQRRKILRPQVLQPCVGQLDVDRVGKVVGPQLANLAAEVAKMPNEPPTWNTEEPDKSQESQC